MERLFLFGAAMGGRFLLGSSAAGRRRAGGRLALGCGCLLETNSSILILAPILYPVAASFGVDIVHFGLIMVVNLAIGFITPPVGVNLFVACGIGDIPFADLVKKIIPFLLVLLFGLLLITYVEDVTLFIPRILGYQG